MNLHPFDMPGDPTVAGIVTCLFWEIVTVSVYGGLVTWMKHHVAKTDAGRGVAAAVALLLAFPVDILQTCIAIPLLNMYRTDCQSFFLVVSLVLDAVLGVAIALRQKEPRPSDPSSPAGNPPASASQAPPAQAPHAHTSGRFPFLNRGHTAGNRGGTP